MEILLERRPTAKPSVIRNLLLLHPSSPAFTLNRLGSIIARGNARHLVAIARNICRFALERADRDKIFQWLLAQRDPLLRAVLAGNWQLPRRQITLLRHDDEAAVAGRAAATLKLSRAHRKIAKARLLDQPVDIEALHTVALHDTRPMLLGDVVAAVVADLERRYGNAQEPLRYPDEIWRDSRDQMEPGLRFSDRERLKMAIATHSAIFLPERSLPALIAQPIAPENTEDDCARGTSLILSHAPLVRLVAVTIALNSETPLRDLQHGTISPQGWKRIANLVEQLYRRQMLLLHDPWIDPDELEIVCREIALRKGDLRLLVMPADNSGCETDRASADALAARFGCGVVLLTGDTPLGSDRT